LIEKKELKMSFEKRVLSIVSKVFDKNPYVGFRSAYFENGTLFVDAPENVARQVFSQLCRAFNFKVQPSKVGNEFAYDFTA
jgi:hypothetical protein